MIVTGDRLDRPGRLRTEKSRAAHADAHVGSGLLMVSARAAFARESRTAHADAHVGSGLLIVSAPAAFARESRAAHADAHVGSELLAQPPSHREVSR